MQSEKQSAERTKKLLVVSTLIIVVLAAVAGYFIYQFIQNQQKTGAVNQATTKRLVSKIDDFYMLPADEEPTVAQVKDKSKLGDQDFFKGAEDGDYLLIYTNSKLAILYRENINKLIKVGPVTVAQQQAATQATEPVAAAKTTVKVLNGTTKSGLAASTGATLASKMGDAVTVDSAYGDAKNKTVRQTIVVAVNAAKADVAKKVADALGGVVSALPAGETAPTADILVIAGQ